MSEVRDAETLKIVAPRRPGPAPKFAPHVIACLATCWMLTRAPAGKRLAQMLATVVPLCAATTTSSQDDEAALLVSMSSASIDRHLAPERDRLVVRGRSHTKPGTLLKSQIPTRTWAEWSEDIAGFVEIDLVGHEGGKSGEFCFTLTSPTSPRAGPSTSRSRTRRPSGCSRPSNTSLPSSPIGFSGSTVTTAASS